MSGIEYYTGRNPSHHYNNMHFEKSESYSLSPDEYLHKFQTPHQTISLKGSSELDERDIQIIE